MKKAQGALEYLMTYGWAILVVVIVGLVLWRSGVFGTSSTGANGFDVLVPAEWKIVNGATGQIVWRNVAGQSLRSVNFSIYDGTNTKTYNNAVTIGAGKQYTLSNVNVSCTPGASVTLDVNVSYVTPAGLAHTDSGTIYADCES